MAPKKDAQKNADCRFCVLPDNNYAHLAMFVFLLISVFIMMSNFKLVTCLSVLFFVIPQIIGLIFLKLKIIWLNRIRVIALVISVCVACFCLLEWAGALTDQGDYYMIAVTSMAFACGHIPKQIIVYSLFTQPAISFMLYFGIPTKQSLALISETKGTKNKKGRTEDVSGGLNESQ